MATDFKYYLIYKPYGMICQFTKEGDHPTLADLNFTFPKDVYPVGRLDTDSEGLLMLSNDKKINHSLLNPDMEHTRSYYVQVEGNVTEENLSELKKGVQINVNGKLYKTLPCQALVISAPELPERNPPIRFRKNIPTSWIHLFLKEGKNRQVRKMTAKIGFPTLRLVRYSMEDIVLEVGMSPGKVLEMSATELYKKLKIKKY